MHKNILHTINATEQTARRDGHTLWYTHLRKLFTLLFLMLASVGVWAQTNANYVPFEFYTSINQITGNFAIVNAAEGKALYGPDAQNIGYTDYATAFAATNVVTQYKLEDAGNGNYRLRCVTPAGGNYLAWIGNPCYLNAQLRVGGVLFNLGLNNQNGQDMENGALWKLNYVAGQGWTIRNVANNGYAAPNNTTQNQAYYWQLCSLAEPNVTTNVGYVITYQNNYFLGGNSTTPIATFNPSTCIWTRNNNVWRNSAGYYLRYVNSGGVNKNNSGTITLDQNNNLDWTLGGAESGTEGARLTRSKRYIYFYNGNPKNWLSTPENDTRNESKVVFAATRQFYAAISTLPTVSGADIITGTGNTTYTRTDAAYQPACYDYVFYNGAHHYCTSVTADATATRPSETFNYTWSLHNENGTAYTGANVSVNNSGVVNYQTYFAEDTRLILRLTASSASKTFTADKAITFKGGCTTPTITFDQSAKTVTITGAAGETIHYTTDDGYSGAAPTASSPTYSAPINITGRTRVRALATKTGYTNSGVASLIVDNPNSITPSTTYIGNVTAGNTVQLSYTLSGQPDADVIYDRVVYSSENSTVASVDQTGLVTANVAGTTNIVMTLYNLDGTVKSTQQIGIVVRNPYNDPNNMSVNASDQTINRGGSWQILATSYGEEPVYQKFKYEVTGTPGIASVDATGLVTGLAEGTTQITVTAYNYGDVLSTLTQTINITVVKTEYIDGKKCIYSLDDIDNANGSYILMQDITASTGLDITFTGTLDGNYHTISGLGSALFNSINGGTVKNVRLDSVSISSGDNNGNVGAIANTATNGAKIYNCGVLSTDGNSSISGSGSVGSIVGQIATSVYVVNCYSYANVTGGEYAAGIVGRVYAVDPYAGRTFRITNNNANNRYLSDPDGTLRLKNAESTWVLESNGGSFYLKNAQTNRYICTGTNGWNSTMNTSKANAISFSIVDHSGVYQISCTNGSLGSDATADGSNVWKDKGYPNNNTQWTIRDAATNQLLVFASGAVVTNCMFYGNMTRGTNRSPVYGGYHVDNIQKPNEYNYYRSKANLTYTAYNEQGAIDKDEFLTRFPFYRHIMNTHRELAAIKLFGSRTDANVNEIGHWVLNTEIAPYPIIEKWETNTKRTTVDIAANLPNTTEAYAGKLLTEMGSGGYLNVTVKIDGTSRTVRLPITDMDTLRYDFTWGKVVLPFANEFDGWTRDYSKVITGWKITSITGETTGALTNYNFADRDCTAKDLYSNSGYIFAQGGNYIVPYGVTEITIEANFANAYYLSDETYDIGYNENYGDATGLNGNVPTTYHDQTVYTNLTTLMGQLTTGKYTPHEQAIVLVGNYHYNQNVVGAVFPDNNTKGLTIMSVDEDNNQEPDYGWYSYHTTDRTNTPSLRFDFVPNIGIGMAARVKGSTPYPTIGIWHSKAWFELTETCVSFMSECEIDDGDFSNTVNINNRWIASSGYFIQIVRAHDNAANRLAYLQIGGNAYVEQLYPGPHMAQGHEITLCPINVTGGEIKECFMTGKGSGTPNATGQNIYFWCAGGRIHKYLSAYMVKPSTADVNVVAKVDHARIYRFFGGGTSPTARITGNINVTMNNSLVDFYCGGPEFGDMENGTTVTTNATGSTFGQFFGAGFGGTSTTWVQRTDDTRTLNTDTYTYPSSWEKYTDSYLQYDNTKGGWGSNYDFEYIMYSGGDGQGVGRFYTGYSDFSLAKTGSVTSTLTNCTVLNDFYGGGCQGTVDGNATSTLENCHIEGNAFAGGYKAPETTVEIYSDQQPTYPIYTRETGLFTFYDKGSHETWTWVEGGTAGRKHDDTKTLETGISFANLGAVTGKATITVKGDSYVAGMIDGQPNGGVFGGGNESPVRGETEVNIASTTTYAIANVYGGANQANVGNNTVVNVTSGKIGNVFGANNVSGTKSGTVTVNIDQAAEKTTLITSNVYGGGNMADYTGNPLVNMKNGTVDGSVFGGGLSALVTGNTDVEVTGGAVNDAVYGGGALANVTGNTVVNLLGGTVHDAFGGGLGRLADNDAVAAEVGGNTTVTLNGSKVTGSIFGANNINGTPLGHVKVHVLQTVARDGQDDEEYHVPAVYGGGNQADYVPTNDFAEVLIENCNNSIDYVYGGGNAAAVPQAQVTINGGTFNYVFAGGNGAGDGNPGADVGYQNHTNTEYGTGTAEAIVHGGVINHLFAGSNERGRIRGSQSVSVDHVGSCDEEILEVYGGGNLAESKAGSVAISCGAIVGDVYGGANQANITSDITLNITGGTINRVFGGNNTSGNVSGSITVNINKSDDCGLDLNYVYGAGNQASYTPSTPGAYPAVNILKGTVKEDVFGGGLGASAVVTSNPTVTINGGTVSGNVFGGGSAANVKGSTSVSLTSGSANNIYGGGEAASVIKTDGGTEGNTTVRVTGGSVVKVDDEGGSIFGGGLGNTTTVAGNVTVSVSGGNIATDVYGGSGFGTVNTDENNTTSVTITNGTIAGNVYGGGFGQVAAGDDPAYVADVNGNVAVNIQGGTMQNVFGCNNANGAPQHDVTVTVNGGTITNNVYGGGNLAAAAVDPIVNIENGNLPGSVFGGGLGSTAVITGNPQVTIGANTGTGTVHIDGNVFGGGDAANVVGKPVVLVQNCNTQIGTKDGEGNWNATGGTVYGGGNAAHVTGAGNGTSVTIYGGDINRVFGGGNGEVSPANVQGDAVTTIHAGNIHQAFAGSNMQGNINGSATITVDHSNEGCPELIDEVYGGGNQAAGNAGTVTIDCGANVGDVYGGANQAEITSDITLNITGGTINRVFGGNNTSGNISGAITVNVNKKDACDLDLNYVYGAGNLASYTPSTPGAYPAVNILKGTVKQDVFGGGLGATAIVTSNPTVTVNGGVVSGNVFGGGSAANVKGSTSVSLTSGSANNIYGGGEAASVIKTDGGTEGNTTVRVTGGSVVKVDDEGGSIFGGGLGNTTTVAGNVTVSVSGGNIATDVYGGSGFGTVNTNEDNTTTVTITNGTIAGNVYGGGFGQVAAGDDPAYVADVNGNVAVNIQGGTMQNVFGCNNANGAPQHDVTVTVNGGTITNNVYGGGNLAAANVNPIVNIENGNFPGSVFGGGLGSTAVITGNPQVTIGANTGTVHIDGNVFGGGDAANVVGKPVVRVQNCSTVIGTKDGEGKWNATGGTVYGGGNAAHVTGAGNGTSVTINGGDINRVFGGGNGEVSPANVAGNAQTVIHAGNIHQAFAGSNMQGSIGGSASISVDHSNTNCAELIDEIYGGGNQAAGNAGTVTIDCGANVGDVYGGANEANIGSSDSHSNIELNITGGHINRVFGGNNKSGTIYGTITVNVDWVGECENYLGYVYGGGNQAAYSVPGTDKNYPKVYVRNATVEHSVFGGGLGSTAVVTGNPKVTIGIGDGSDVDHTSTLNNHRVTINDNVFGGGSAANVVGSTRVNVNAGEFTSPTTHVQINGHVFGGGEAALVQDSTNVLVKGSTVDGYVYGGGNAGPVGTSSSTKTYTKVIVDNSEVKKDVFGGGLGAPVYGNTAVWIKGENCFIHGSVLGGGFGGDVTGDTHVQIGGETDKYKKCHLTGGTADCND